MLMMVFIANQCPRNKSQKVQSYPKEYRNDTDDILPYD